MRLKDKVAVVTGGSSGIGRAISILFCQQGAKVAVFDIQPESRLADETPDVMTAIKNISGTADYYSVDVTNLSQVNSAVDTVLEKWGRIDILVNNAGIFIRNPITDVSDEEWDKVINTNLRGYFYMCRKVIPTMVNNHYGKIINMSSIHGLVGTGTAATYCASKGGITNFTRQLAVDYAKNGINVNDNCGSTHMEPLMSFVRENNLDAGVAFDGDGDRVAFVDEKGTIIPGDFITALIAREILKHKPGERILYDLRSSWVVPEEIKRAGGEAVEFARDHGLRDVYTAQQHPEQRGY